MERKKHNFETNSCSKETCLNFVVSTWPGSQKIDADKAKKESEIKLVYIERIGNNWKRSYDLQPCVIYDADGLMLRRIRVCAVKEAYELVKKYGWKTL